MDNYILLFEPSKQILNDHYTTLNSNYPLSCQGWFLNELSLFNKVEYLTSNLTYQIYPKICHFLIYFKISKDRSTLRITLILLRVFSS